MRVADYIIDRLNKKYGVKYIPILTGNGALVLNDALGQNKNITPICCHHEQHCGYISLGMSKYTNKLSVVMTTTGCAATNAITPLLAAYQDHVPILFLSGDINLKQTSRYHRLHNKINAKKIGNQEADIIEIVKPITKHSIMAHEAKYIKYHLDYLIDISLTPPFGPVWLNLPADVAASQIEEKDFIEYQRQPGCLNEAPLFRPFFSKNFLPEIIKQYLDELPPGEELRRFGRENPDKDGLYRLSQLCMNRYVKDIKNGDFPSKEYCFQLKSEELDKLRTSKYWKIENE